MAARPRDDVVAEGLADSTALVVGSTMKLAVATCAPGPGRLGPILADPSTTLPSVATTVWPGGGSIHQPAPDFSVRPSGYA